MKKVIKAREIMIIITSLILIMVATEVFAFNPVLGDDTNNATLVPKNEYDNASNIPVNNIGVENDTNDNNLDGNNTNENNTNVGNNTKGNNTKVYNTGNTTDLPQTGIEDYNIGILLIICIATAIFAYRKITDYRNI